jgi:hypothetical protein
MNSSWHKSHITSLRFPFACLANKRRKVAITPACNSYGAKWSDLKLSCFIFSVATYAACMSSVGRS